MDPEVDRGAQLIARNRELLARASRIAAQVRDTLAALAEDRLMLTERKTRQQRVRRSRAGDRDGHVDRDHNAARAGNRGITDVNSFFRQLPPGSQPPPAPTQPSHDELLRS
jgi:hypothetical protein